MIWWFVIFAVLACICLGLVVSAIADGLRVFKPQPSTELPSSPYERELRLLLVQLEYMLQALPLVTAPAFEYLKYRKKLKYYDLPRIAMIYSSACRDMQKGRWQDAHGSALYAICLCQRVLTDVCLEVGLEKTRRDAEKSRTAGQVFGIFNHAFALNYYFELYKYEPWTASESGSGERRLRHYQAKFDRLCAELSGMLEDANKGV
jgi:hypothetical protein